MLDIKFILLIIFAVIWVIGNVVRSKQEEPRTPPPRRPPPREPNPQARPTPTPTQTASRPTPPVSDIDRFLQEIDRLRRKNVEDQAVAEPPKPKPPPPPPREEPKPKPRTSEPQQPQTRAPKQAKQAKQAKTAPKRETPPAPTGKRAPGGLATELDARDAAAAAEAQAASPTVSSDNPLLDQISSAKPQATTSFPEIRRGVEQTKGSPAELLIALLKSRKGMPIAFVLREILEDPKCKRPPTPPPEAS